MDKMWKTICIVLYTNKQGNKHNAVCILAAPFSYKINVTVSPVLCTYKLSFRQISCVEQESA